MELRTTDGATNGSSSEPDYVRRRGELPFGLSHRDEYINYFTWQAGLFKPHLRGRVLDHGAGTGSLSLALLNAGARTLVVVEPDPELVTILHQRFDGQSNVEVVPGTLEAYLSDVGPQSVDCIVSANVLEHIEDDRACLAGMRELLRPAGALCLYVPARPELYGTLDQAVGHHRRYTRRELIEKLVAAGFDVTRVEYRNLLGVLPWLVAGRLLKKESVGRTSIKLVDRVVVPLCCSLENVLTPPYGLNLVAVAVRRTA